MSLFDVPLQPLLGLAYDHGVVHVHVHAHQVVEVALLRVHVRVPLLPSEAVYAVPGLAVFVPVCAGEVGVIPLEGAVFAISAGEVEHGPDLDALLPVDLFVAVYRGVADGDDVLCRVAAHSVIQYDVGEHLNAGLVESVDGSKVFLLGAVFGSDGALLVELAQIVHIIDAIAHVRLAGALVGGWQPNLGDAQVAQIGRLGCAAPPPQAVVGQVPFKVLHHCIVNQHISHFLSFRRAASRKAGEKAFV